VARSSCAPGSESVRIRAGRVTTEGQVTERLRLPVGPSSKLRTRAAARLAADRGAGATRSSAQRSRRRIPGDFAELYDVARPPSSAAALTTQAAYRSHLRCHLVPFLNSLARCCRRSSRRRRPSWSPR
jgi:hypothetical protein